jgi:hypothetical protein
VAKWLRELNQLPISNTVTDIDTLSIALIIPPRIKVNARVNKIKNDCLDVLTLLFEIAALLINWQHIFLSINYLNIMTFEVSNEPASKSILKHFGPAHTFSPLSSTIYFNIIFPFAHKSFKVFVPSGFPTNILVYFPSSP